MGRLQIIGSHLGKSMSNVFTPKDQLTFGLFESPKEIEEFHEGDLLLLRNHKQWVVHRVVRNGKQKTTKGDMGLCFDELKGSSVWGEFQKLNSMPVKKNKFVQKTITRISIYHSRETFRLLRIFLKGLLLFFGYIERQLWMKKYFSRTL